MGKRRGIGLAPVALLLAPVFAGGQQVPAYEIHPSPEGRFALEVSKTGLWAGRKHLFLFRDYHGSLRFDLESPGNSTVQFAVEGPSAACQDTWVSQSDLRNIQSKALEMMDVARHPQLVFVSQRIVPLGFDRYEVQGTLEIAGIARPVTLSVTLNKREPGALMFHGSAVVRLKDYRLKPPSAALGLIGTQNEMAVEFDLQANKLP